MRVGQEVASRAVDEGHVLLAVGEVGIGNTTAAAALVCALTSSAPADIVGHGTGISEQVRARKVCVVQDALRMHASRACDPLGRLAAFGGLELAAMRSRDVAPTVAQRRL